MHASCARAPVQACICTIKRAQINAGSPNLQNSSGSRQPAQKPTRLVPPAVDTARLLDSSDEFVAVSPLTEILSIKKEETDEKVVTDETIEVNSSL